jgi:hypothetical protein
MKFKISKEKAKIFNPTINEIKDAQTLVNFAAGKLRRAQENLAMQLIKAYPKYTNFAWGFDYNKMIVEFREKIDPDAKT